MCVSLILLVLGFGWLLVPYLYKEDHLQFLNGYHPRGDAGGLSREYVLRIPSVS